MGDINFREEVANYQEAMTDSERMMKYMSGEVVDHLPFNFLSADQAFANILGYTTSDINDDVDKFAEVVRKKVQEYRVGAGINVGLNLRTVGASVGSVLSYPENGVDHVEKYALDYSLDVDSLELPDPYNNEVLTPLLERARKLKEIFPDETISTSVTGPVSNATSIRPIEKLLKDTRKNWEEVSRLLEFCNEVSMLWVKAFVNEFGPCPISIADPVSCTDILSPKQFEKISFPYLLDLSHSLEEVTTNKPALHICGHTKGIWPYLKKLNISSFSVDNWEDIGETKEAFGDIMPIVGNIPPTDILLLGSPEDVIESVKTCIKKAADSPCGYIVNSGCQIVFSTPRENLDAYTYAVRKYSANARLGEIPEAVYQD